MTPEQARRLHLTGAGIGGAIGAAVLLATPLIASWEGKVNYGYRDIIGVPTYCYGGTGPNAVVGRHYTDQECATQLAQDVRAHALPLQRCVSPNTPTPTFAALISLSFNIGPDGVCRSSIVRYINAGNIAEGCRRFDLYNRAGGRVVQGLVNRRAAERRLCEQGITR